MITVYLYGKLKDLFGGEYRLEVDSPVEAIRALEANNHGRFVKEFVKYNYHVIRGSDLDTGEYDSEETLKFCRDADIHFVPIVTGSKRAGLGLLIAGIIIIATAGFGAWTASGVVAQQVGMGAAIGYGAGLSTAFGFTYGSAMLFGASIMLAGIAQMLTPTPGEPKDIDSKDSFVFTGGNNISAQGSNVPLIYGEIEVGSIVVSESLTAENI